MLEPERYYTVPEVLELLNAGLQERLRGRVKPIDSIYTVKRYLRDGRLRGTQYSRHDGWRVLGDDITAFLDYAQGAGAMPPKGFAAFLSGLDTTKQLDDTSALAAYGAGISRAWAVMLNYLMNQAPDLRESVERGERSVMSAYQTAKAREKAPKLA